MSSLWVQRKLNLTPEHDPFFCKVARVKGEVEKGSGHREMEWCQETSTFTLQLSAL